MGSWTDSLIQDLSELQHDQKLADFTFLVGPTKTAVRAHKQVLYARCPGLRKRLNQQDTNCHLELPGISRQAFQAAMTFIYTAQVQFTKDSVVQLCFTAELLGMTSLSALSLRYFQSCLSTQDVCHMMCEIHRLWGARLFDQGSPECLQVCVMFFMKNPAACSSTDSWRHLPEPLLKGLTTNNTLPVENKDVQSALLAWAAHQAGGTSKPNLKPNRQQDMAMVTQALQQLLGTTKKLLLERIISSSPTCRVHSPGNRHGGSTDSFPGSEILTDGSSCYQSTLNSWYGRDGQRWRLLYRATTHGHDATSFHKACDGYVHTYVIVLGMTGNICGGFTDIPWSSSSKEAGKYSASNRSYLFSLVNKYDHQPTKFDVIRPSFAICSHPSYGPIFGGGADFLVASDCDRGMRCYSNLPHSYNGKGASANVMMGAYSFNILDYEVYTPVT